MNSALKLSIVEMELAGMWAKMQSMQQNMLDTREEREELEEIATLIDALRRKIGARIALSE